MLIFFVLVASIICPDIPEMPGTPDIPKAPRPDTPDTPVPGPPPAQDVQFPASDIGQCKDKAQAAQVALKEKAAKADVECPSTAPVGKRSIIRRGIDVGDVRNQCLPLVSQDIVANPYHADLIGVDPNKVLTRSGYGRPFYLDGEIDTKGSEGATWTLTKSQSFSKSVMIGITFNDGTTNTKVNGTTWSSANSNSIQSSINNVLEASNTTASTSDISANFARDIQDSLTNTIDKQSASTTNWNKEDSDANAETWNNQKGSTTTEDEYTDVAKTEGTIVTNGWDRQNEHSNTVDVAINEVFTCTFSKSGISGSTTTHETNYQIHGDIGLSFDAKPMGVGAGATVNIGAAGGGSTSLQGSLTMEDSKSLTYTFSVTSSKSELMAARCGTNGNTQKHDLTTTTTHKSTQYGTSINEDKGGSKTKTKSRSEGGSGEERRSDAIAKGYTNGWTNTTGWNSGKTDTYGSTLIKGVTNTSDYGFTTTSGGDLSSSIAITHSVDRVNQTTDTTTWEIARSLQFHIAKDACVKPSCSPRIKSTVVPWACSVPNTFDNTGSRATQIVTTEIQQRIPEGSDIQDVNVIDCTYVLVSCADVRRQRVETMPVYRPDDSYKFDRNTALYTDKNLHTGVSTDPTPEKYYFGWGEHNEFGIYTMAGGAPSSFDTKVWGCGVELGKSGGRIIISDAGQIQLRAEKGFFDDNGESSDIVIWSTLPAHLNETVGIIGNRYKNPNFGYKFMISENGIGELYDSAYVKIWSTNNDFDDGNRHSYGYKFPIHVPYRLVTPINPNAPCNYVAPNPYVLSQVDKNNEKPNKIKWLGTELKHGTAMNQDEGIKSPDGSITLYLSSSPNIIIKEGCRTLWETYTANPWQGVAPYILVVSTKGQIVIKDFDKRVIWATDQTLGVIRSMSLSDSGVLQGFDVNGTLLWQSRNDDPNIPGGHVAYSTPIIDYDDEAEVPPMVLQNFPLVNIYTSRCITVFDNATVSTAPIIINRSNYTVDFSMCQLFNLNPLVYTYTLAGTRTKCLGHGQVEICNINTLWRHYTDGLLINMNTGACLGRDAQPINCIAQDLRIDKLWSRGLAPLVEFGTNSSTIMLKGNMFMQGNMSFIYTLNSDNEVTFEAWDHNDMKDIKYHVWNTRIKATDNTVLKLLENGLSVNVTRIKQYNGDMFQNGVPPYSMQIDPIGLRIKDAKFNTVWNWPF